MRCRLGSLSVIQLRQINGGNGSQSYPVAARVTVETQLTLCMSTDGSPVYLIEHLAQEWCQTAYNLYEIVVRIRWQKMW